MTPPDEGYDGPATVTLPDETTRQVDVRLRGFFQPIDGRYHWHGRVALDGVTGAAEVELRTTTGTARGRLSDLDPWGRWRVAGVGRPPYRLEVPEAGAGGPGAKG